MTLEVCKDMLIKHCDMEFTIQPMESETEIAAKNLQNINEELMFQTNPNELEEDNIGIIENIQNGIEYMPTEIQNCVEVESTNIITIPENQIVEIQFQTDHGTVNTEYIVENSLIENNNIKSTFINLKDGVYEEIIPYHVIENPINSSTDNFELVQQMEESIQRSNDDFTDNIINIPMLSPPSENDEQSETDLTSLNWLHNITNIMSMPNIPTPPVSPPPKPKRKSTSNQEDLTININYYKKNGDKKPPFSYATLICMAMSKNGNKMTLSAIYNWILENFLYYRKAHPSWQVS